MLPKRFRFWLFDRLSVKTMRYVSAVPTRKATGLVRRVYEMIQEDFFINGSLTSRSAAPGLLAAIWTAGRESILVDDRVDRTTKEAIAAVLSYGNDCPYCADMLVSLTHAGDQHEAAGAILDAQFDDITDPVIRARLAAVDALIRPGNTGSLLDTFAPEEIPEVLGTIMAMSDINRFSHVVMDGSPVKAGRLQGAALRWFGGELRSTKQAANEPGRALPLLPKAPLPPDLEWAASNPRVADAGVSTAGTTTPCRSTASGWSGNSATCAARSGTSPSWRSCWPRRRTR
ncbi:MAG: carboxymuconolactone decarboxylase family protein [Planctomycetota bacterium]|jgi:AhpD family alkylhydroperoxidase